MPKERAVLWLNDEPVNCLGTGAFEVEGYPAISGRNVLRVGRDRPGASAAHGFQVAMISGIKPDYRSIGSTGEFTVSHGKSSAPAWNKVPEQETDSEVIRTNVHALLEALCSQDRKGLVALFQGQPNHLLKNFPAGLFADKKWTKRVHANTGDLRIVTGHYLLLVFSEGAEEAPTKNLLEMESATFDYRLNCVQLFYNADGDLAIYSPGLAGKSGFVFQKQATRTR